MTLQSSGPISLSQVNVELGLASTATVSLGSTSVRGLAGVASGAISLSNLYGKSNILDTQSVYVDQGIQTDGKTWWDTYTGFYGAFWFGSITDGTSNVYGGTSISGIYHVASSDGANDGIWLTFDAPVANSGWNSININGTVLHRVNAQYLNNGFRWPNPTAAIANPFTAVNTWTTVTFA